MPIYLGNNQIDMQLGSSAITRVYLGSNLIYVTIPKDGLIVWLDAKNYNTTTKVIPNMAPTGATYNATFFNNPTFNTTYLTFNGTSQYGVLATKPIVFTASTQYTMIVKFMLLQAQQTKLIVGSGFEGGATELMGLWQNYETSLPVTNNYRVYAGNINQSTSASVFGQWTTIAMTMTPTQLTTVYQGVTNTTTGARGTGTLSNFYIGNSSSTSQSGFYGRIASIYIYNRVLTADEINTILWYESMIPR